MPGKYAEAATQRLLKEMLYENIIEYFDKGKVCNLELIFSVIKNFVDFSCGNTVLL